MNVSESYKIYKILPILQLHQLRVAAVAKLICDSLKDISDSSNIISACLVHDMGNIIKFDLSIFPDALNPKGLEYWQKVKSDFNAKYGSDEKVATLKIAEELNLSKRTIELIDATGFSKAKANIDSNDISKMITCYADQRVSPSGVQSLEERTSEGKLRYLKRVNNDGQNALKLEEIFNMNLSALEQIEELIFHKSSIKPQDITDSNIEPLINLLKNYILV